MTHGPLRKVPAVLARFDGTFSAFAGAFQDGQYVLWLGSGISRDRVPNVGALLDRVLELLRSNIVTDSADCVYRCALLEVLRLAGLTADDLSSIDYAQPVRDWPLRDRIITALIPNYARVFDVLVGDENPDDYLVWTGLDVPNTYGSPDLEPDVEHFCIAILMLEGLVASAVTANWDGLLEKALGELAPAFDSLVRVAVRAEDFRIAGPPMEIIKFHGCAVRARKDEATYRDLLIARQSQISGWTEQPRNRSMRKHLEAVYTDRLTLMVGLSAQDANLQTVFATAIQDLARPWPSTPPAVVLSEETLETHHRTLLKLTYSSNHQGNSAAIAESALLGAYGKPTLLALVLDTLASKLGALLEFGLAAPGTAVTAEPLRAGLRSLRDAVSAHADRQDREGLDYAAVADHQRDFISRLIDVTSLASTVFRTGRTNVAPGYQPLSDRPVKQAVHGADFPAGQFGRLGVALALIGVGLASGEWSAMPGSSSAAGDGVMRLITDTRSVRLFFVKDGAILTQLEMDESFDESDGNVLVVVADEERRPFTRSPRPRYGRDGGLTAGRFNVASGLSETETADELLEAFKLAGGF